MLPSKEEFRREIFARKAKLEKKKETEYNMYCFEQKKRAKQCYRGFGKKYRGGN